jgi:hypothetical protein
VRRPCFYLEAYRSICHAHSLSLEHPA